MDKEFPEEYKTLFDFGMKRLKRCHTIKLHAIKFCMKKMCQDNDKEKDALKGALKKKMPGLNQQSILAQQEVNLESELFYPVQTNELDDE